MEPAIELENEEEQTADSRSLQDITEQTEKGAILWSFQKILVYATAVDNPKHSRVQDRLKLGHTVSQCLRMQSIVCRTQSHYAEMAPTVLYHSGSDNWQLFKSSDEIGCKLYIAEVELAQWKADAQRKVNAA